MKKFEVGISFSGYSRGHRFVEVEAENEEEAKLEAGQIMNSESLEDYVVRDDREIEVEEVEELTS